MKEGGTAQRRSVCTLTGMAIGFRAFLAVALDGGELYGSGWIVLTAGMVLSIPVAAALMIIRRLFPHEEAAGALSGAGGRIGVRLTGTALFLILVCDAGSVLQMMSTAARYVAAPESNRNIIKLVTALTAAAAAALGPCAAAGAAVLWRRLAAVLIVLLILVQAPYFRPGWLTPVLGPGIPVLMRGALPAAGIFSLTAAGWLMLEREHDPDGKAMLRTLMKSGAVTAALATVLAMLVPGMADAPTGRAFRLGRLLANDRAGLTLELPYVILLYSGMLTMLVFEVTAAARAIGMALPALNSRMGAMAAGGLAFCLSVSDLARQEKAALLSVWYYPVILSAFVLLACNAVIRKKMRKAGNAPERSGDR